MATSLAPGSDNAALDRAELGDRRVHLDPGCRCQDVRVRRAAAPLLAVTVALVLADSAVVTLALPHILRHLDTTVGQVAWVLISFNLVLGLAAVPTAIGFTRA